MANWCAALKPGMFSCHIWQLPASLKDTIAGKFWNDVQNLPDLDILFSYVQTPILATLVSTKFAKFVNRHHLPILATDNICQFWQLRCRFGHSL